jgi:hypothetical protein
MKCEHCEYETKNKKSMSNHTRYGCPKILKFSTIKCKYCKNLLPKRKPSEEGLFCNNKCYFKWKKGVRLGNRKDKVLISNYWYVYIPGHPRSNKRTGYVPEQVHLMELKINRFLNDDETVHHIDHVSTNNDILNLKLMTKHDHLSYHAKINHKKAGGKKWSKER